VEIPCGMVESTWNIGGRKSPKWVRSQPKHIPCGMGRFHVEQHGFHIDSTWIPCGIRGQGKDLKKVPIFGVFGSGLQAFREH